MKLIYILLKLVNMNYKKQFELWMVIIMCLRSVERREGVDLFISILINLSDFQILCSRIYVVILYRRAVFISLHKSFCLNKQTNRIFVPYQICQILFTISVSCKEFAVA